MDSSPQSASEVNKARKSSTELTVTTTYWPSDYLNAKPKSFGSKPSSVAPSNPTASLKTRAMSATPYPVTMAPKWSQDGSNMWAQEKLRCWQDWSWGRQSMSPHYSWTLTILTPPPLGWTNGLSNSSKAPRPNSTPLPRPHAPSQNGQPMWRSSATDNLTMNTANSRTNSRRYPYVSIPSKIIKTHHATTWRQVDSRKNSPTSKVAKDSIVTTLRLLGEATTSMHATLSQVLQSRERVMSPPQHTVKLPSWLHKWYHEFYHDLARHVLVSHIDQLIASLSSSESP
jgi:hypothetical protein